jgi:hypothetical protein
LAIAPLDLLDKCETGSGKRDDHIADERQGIEFLGQDLVDPAGETADRFAEKDPVSAQQPGVPPLKFSNRGGQVSFD